MNTITLKDIRVYAFHGCLSQETKIGSDYLVQLSITADLLKASKTDELEDTVDYVHLNAIVKQEMDIPSKLLEHVAQRIIERILKELKMVETITIEVAKVNPPIGGDVASVAVQLEAKR